MIKRWVLPLASLSAVAGVIALALFLAGVFDGDDSASVGGPESAAICAEGSPDCDDTIVVPDTGGDDGDGASIAPGCALGFPDCVDTVVQDNETGEAFDGDGPTSAPVCAPGFPDCVDMIVNGANGDVDEEDPPDDPIEPRE